MEEDKNLRLVRAISPLVGLDPFEPNHKEIWNKVQKLVRQHEDLKEKVNALLDKAEDIKKNIT